MAALLAAAAIVCAQEGPSRYSEPAGFDCERHLVGGQRLRQLHRRVCADWAAWRGDSPQRQILGQRARVVQLVALVGAAPDAGRVAGRDAALHGRVLGSAFPVAGGDDGLVPWEEIWEGLGSALRCGRAGGLAGAVLKALCSCGQARARLGGCKRAHPRCHCMRPHAPISALAGTQRRAPGSS